MKRNYACEPELVSSTLNDEQVSVSMIDVALVAAKLGVTWEQLFLALGDQFYCTIDSYTGHKQMTRAKTDLANGLNTTS